MLPLARAQEIRRKNDCQERQRQRTKLTETEEKNRLQLGLTNLAGFFYTISGGSKLSWLMRCL